MGRAGEKKRRWAPALPVAGLMIAVIAFVADEFYPEGRYKALFFLCHELGVLLVIISAIVAVISGGAAMRTRRRIVLSAGAALMAAYLVVATAFWWALGGHYDLNRLKYDDNWIIGRNIAEVEERYGDAEEWGSHSYCYTLYRDEAAIMPSHSVMYYVMYTDDSGVVTEIKERHRPGE